MKCILAIWVIIVLVGLLFVSLVNLEDHGVSSVVLAGISALALFRIFKFLLGGGKPEGFESNRPSGDRGLHDPLEYVIYGDIPGECDKDE